MSCIPDMTTSLAAAVVPVVPRTGKIIKNGRVFERAENLLQNGMLQNGILHFAFMLSQCTEIVLQS